MQLMGESSNSSSSKQPQHPAQIESQEEKRSDTKANGGFTPENRSTTNIVKVTPPSVVIMEDEKEHPLLYLHQSVSGTSREGNGNRGKHGNNPQPPKHPQPLLPKRNSSTTMNMNEKGKIDTAHTKKQKTPMATVLFAVPIIISLLILGLPHVNSVISNMNLGDALHGMLSYLCTTLSTAYLLIISIVKGLSRDKILSVLPSFDTRKVALPIGQLEQRLELGFDLLRKYDDASGSSAICESVLHSILRSHGEPQDESWKGSTSSMTLLFGVDEYNLLSKAYRCIGEAKLSLFTSSITSQSFKNELLTKAKENFESATAIDPTDPSIRSGLGLVYLLLGMSSDEVNNNSQFIFQSIQHLKASIGVIDKSDYNNTDDAIAMRIAAMHNLGLAYILLDGKSSPESPAGVGASHFIDWLTQYRSIQTAHSVINSSVILSNEGAMLLQMGMLEDAILHLEMAREDCIAALPFSRQQDVCLIIHNNLAAARSALYEKEADQTGEYFPVGDEDDEMNDDASSSSDDSAGEHESNIEVSPSIEPIEENASAIRSTQMQKVLSSLEKAALEGTQRTHLLLSLARARASTDDISGAVDATLRAVNAATSADEVDTSTTYLDKLMEKLAGKDKEQPIHIFKEDQSSRKADESTTFAERKDLSFLELEMKLELERLRYKVLQQEMRLDYQSNSAQSLDNFRAIDYEQKMNDAARDTPSDPISLEVTEESVTMSQNAIKIVAINTSISDIPEESTLPLDDAETNELKGLKSDANANETNPEEKSESIENQTASTHETASSNSDYTQKEIQNTTISDDRVNVTSDDSDLGAIELPPLFSPDLKAPTPISPTAKSYMKMADAYLDKGQFALASKQFLKVMKKAPDHLPAYLGYATALERAGNAKQLHTAALAYGNATQLAIIQGDEVDPLAKTGAGGIAENILRRAVTLAKSAPNRKLETLKQLNAYAHTAAIAADIYYEIGLEIGRQGIEQENKELDATQAFTFANEFIAIRNDTQTPHHIGSIIELGKLALEKNDTKTVIDLFNKVKNVHMEDDAHVQLLVLAGRGYVMRGDVETAITEFTRAISFPELSSTASAHHELATTLKKNNGDTHEINLHFEKALNLGMDPTKESIDALGENNMAVVRALRRQYYRSIHDGGNSDSNTRSGGGIMSGGGVHSSSSSSSAFAPHPKHHEDAPTDQSDTLAILEQGAASYDGNTPMGGEIEGTESSLSNLKAKKIPQGSESNLSSLRR